MSNQVSPYPVRMNPDLRTWLEQQAAANHRSLNGEITARLEQQRQRDQRRQRQQEARQ